MAAACQIGIVADEGIARLHVIKRVARQDRLDRTDHRTEMDRDMIGLGDQPAGRIEQGGRAVAALLDVGGEGGADQDRAHVLGDGQEAVAEHLHLDRIEESVWRGAACLSKCSRACSCGHLQDDVAVGIDGGALAGQDDRRRAHLVDDAGAVDRRGGRQPRALVDGRVLPAMTRIDIDGPAADARALNGRAAHEHGHRRLWHLADRLHAAGYEFDGLSAMK